ncbi:aspartate aminotransferase family protein [Patescibacteria group bacterium]
MIKNNILYTNFLNWEFSVTKAEGSYIWNQNNKKLIDFTSGWNVTNLGWNNTEVIEAIVKQTKINTFIPMWLSDQVQVKYAKDLTNSMPKQLDLAVRATGGTDANDKALMLARAITKRKKVIGCYDTYHGHSFGTISIGYRPEHVVNESPIVPEFIKLNFPVTTENETKDKKVLKDFLADLEELLKKEDIACVITEAGVISGWGSTYIAPYGYLKEIRKLTKKYGTLLILDEVGTGFSRCGQLWGMQIEKVVPDMVTLAKGITNGSGAMGAVVLKSSYGEELLSNSKTHSTFGWMPLPVAAACAVIKIHKRDKVWEKAKVDGIYVLDQLKKELGSLSNIGTINGIGLEIGLTFVKAKKTKGRDNDMAKKVISTAYKKGLHLALGGEGNIQIMPPLTTSRKVLDEGLEMLIESVKTCSK